MIRAAALVLGLLILGQTAVDLFALPFPGASVGMILLVMIFEIRGGPDAGSGQLFDFAAPYFQLLFVPAAVGVIINFDLLYASWAFFFIAIFVATSASLVCTGLAFQALLRRSSPTVDA